VSIKAQHNITHASVGNATAMLRVMCQSGEFMSYVVLEGVVLTFRIRGFPCKGVCFQNNGFLFRIRGCSLG